MTLHENLERKRRQNIVKLNQSGACHLCDCTSGARTYRRFVGVDDDSGGDADCPGKAASEGNADCLIAVDPSPAEVVPMRRCMCYGNAAANGWPFPLKVCEMCVADDVTTGRIRSCGICGIVACDDDCGEHCGVRMVEATDRDSWNNAGCLECRGMESFSEMELFRRRPYPNGIPRATRICTGCLELFSLFSFGIKYHFTCRYFKCTNLLVPSDVVELKRFLKPFPLSLLPDELLDSIVEFLGGKDLYSFGLVCTSTFRKVESVSMEIVTNFNDELPTGPTQVVIPEKNTDTNTITVNAEGKNTHSLRWPEDARTWVGVLNQMEHLTRDIYYFRDDCSAAMRYLRKSDKLTFECVYSKPSGTGVITPFSDTDGFLVRGGQVLVTRYKWYHNSLFGDGDNQQQTNGIRSVIFSTGKALVSGVQRVLIRYFCICDGDLLGTIGILRKELALGDTPLVTWAQCSNVSCHVRMEEHVFGIEYDSNNLSLMVYKKNPRTNKMESTSNGTPLSVSNQGGSLFFAAALSLGSAGIKGNQMSIRACNEEEWTEFLNHTVERKNCIARIRGRGRRGEERFMRYLDHRARRAMINENHDDDIAARVEVEHMMEMMMDDANNDSDSDFEGNNVNVQDAPVLLPNVAAAENID